MDRRLNDAATALAAGDPLRALTHVALHDDAVSLALRGIALAQLGDLPKAKALLVRALRAFGPRAGLERARCVTALAEVALAARELGVPLRTLRGAVQTLDSHGDVHNAMHARLLLVRTLVLSGQLAHAEQALAAIRLRADAPPAQIATAELIRAELALRRIETRTARRALERAAKAAEHAGIRALSREIAQTARALALPAARIIARGQEQSVRLDELERVLSSAAMIVDSRRRELQCGPRLIALTRKPVLFALLRVLAEAWPQGASRESLIVRGFGARVVNASHRSRLRVELGRLRKQIASVARLQADAHGYRLEARSASRVLVIAPPVEGENAALLALLDDGAGWSSSGLALALGVSQRTLQRALLALQASRQVRSLGKGRARRWFGLPLAAADAQHFTIGCA